tara:strand:+ start:2754 stop:3740 length:987 start_codon:yes stop_codon:yes gene_type:complete
VIVFGWSELPNYAIDCLKYLNKKKKILLLTDNKKAKNLLPSVNIKIIELNKTYSWEDLGCVKPTYFFFTGWNNKAFNNLAKTKIAKNICLIDNIYKGTLRQFLGKFYFKIFLQNLFDAVLVPGFKSKEFIEYLGYKKKIYKGLYSCNNKIFRIKKINKFRKYDFIFIGKFIKRKNLNLLLEVFKKLQKIYPNIKLNIIGGKKIKNKNTNVIYKGLLKYEEVSNQLKNSKCLVLPSVEEHWGVVVHEAISCGCILILSNQVGSRHEYLKGNGYDFDPKSSKELFNIMEKVITTDKKKIQLMSKKSLKLSSQNSINSWISIINKIILDLN